MKMRSQLREALNDVPPCELKGFAPYLLPCYELLILIFDLQRSLGNNRGLIDN